MGSQVGKKHLKKPKEFTPLPSFGAFLASVLSKVTNSLLLLILKQWNQLIIVHCLQSLFATFHDGELSRNIEITAASIVDMCVSRT
jgi:hypothetical protein